MITLLTIHLVIATASLLGLLWTYYQEFNEVLLRDLIFCSCASFLIPVGNIAGIVMAIFYGLGKVFKNKLDKKLF